MKSHRCCQEVPPLSISCLDFDAEIIASGKGNGTAVPNPAPQTPREMGGMHPRGQGCTHARWGCTHARSSQARGEIGSWSGAVGENTSNDPKPGGSSGRSSLWEAAAAVNPARARSWVGAPLPRPKAEANPREAAPSIGGDVVMLLSPRA